MLHRNPVIPLEYILILNDLANISYRGYTVVGSKERKDVHESFVQMDAAKLSQH